MSFKDALEGLRQDIQSTIDGKDRVRPLPPIDPKIGIGVGKVEWVNEGAQAYFKDLETRKPFEFYVTEVRDFHGQTFEDMRIRPGAVVEYQPRGNRVMITKVR